MQKALWMVFRLQEPDNKTFQYWAIRSQEIREILHNPVVYPIPRVPGLLLGCLWYRGRIYSVIHLGRLMFPTIWPEEPLLDYYIAVLDSPQAPLALHLGDWMDTLREEDLLPMEPSIEIPTLATSVVGWFSSGHTLPVFLMDIPTTIQRIDRATLDFVRDAFQPIQQRPRSNP